MSEKRQFHHDFFQFSVIHISCLSSIYLNFRDFCRSASLAHLKIMSAFYRAGSCDRPQFLLSCTDKQFVLVKNRLKITTIMTIINSNSRVGTLTAHQWLIVEFAVDFEMPTCLGRVRIFHIFQAFSFIISKFARPTLKDNVNSTATCEKIEKYKPRKSQIRKINRWTVFEWRTE